MVLILPTIRSNKTGVGIGFGELNPQPYWGFDDLKNKAGTKLLNTFYIQTEVKVNNGKKYYKHTKIMMLQKFSFNGFLKSIENFNPVKNSDGKRYWRNFQRNSGS